MSKVTDMTKEELLSSLDEHIKEVVFRYNDVWESYENLDEDYKRLQSRYNELKEENEKKEIHVGDEVVDKNGKKYIVRNLDNEYIYLLGRRGVADVRKYSDVSKTGKYYPIDEIIKELE